MDLSSLVLYVKLAVDVCQVHIFVCTYTDVVNHNHNISKRQRFVGFKERNWRKGRP